MTNITYFEIMFKRVRKSFEILLGQQLINNKPKGFAVGTIEDIAIQKKTHEQINKQARSGSLNEMEHA